MWIAQGQAASRSRCRAIDLSLKIRIFVIELLLYLFIGAIAGLSAGLLGVGGGIVIVPIFSIFFKAIFPSSVLMHMAIGTSLTIMIFTAVSSTYAYQWRGLVQWPLFYRFIPGMALGVITGSLIAMYLTSQFLQISFAFFLLVIALKMFDTRKIHAHRQLPQWFGLNFVAFCTGILSGFFGIGGGVIMVPFFVYCNVPMQRATATSVACGLMLSVIGTISFIIMGLCAVNMSSLPTGTTGFVYWPAVLPVAMTSIFFAPLGTQIAVSISPQLLQRIFAIALLVTAFYLVAS